MTEKQRTKLLARANHKYAQNFISKRGERIYDKNLDDILVDFAREVIDPRGIEKGGEGHH